MIEYRNMRASDISAAMGLCRQAGWNQLERDWQLFLRLGPGDCKVAVSGRQVVGTVATIRYGHHFSWIGMVLVDKASQRQGIGKRLLETALDILQQEETIKLDATPTGRMVYLKMDFVDEYRLRRMGMGPATSPTGITSARQVELQDLPALISFDKEIFGAWRGELLAWMWEGAAEQCLVVEGQNLPAGYCMCRNGYDAVHIGPVIARDIEIAKELVTASLQRCAGRPIILDVLTENDDWMSWLNSIGFAEKRILTRMYRGSNRYAGQPAKQFAILGPEFG